MVGTGGGLVGNGHEGTTMVEGGMMGGKKKKNNTNFPKSRHDNSFVRLFVYTFLRRFRPFPDFLMCAFIIPPT